MDNKICITIILCTVLTCFTYAYMNRYSQIIGANGNIYFDYWKQEAAVLAGDGKLYSLKELRNE